MKKLYFIFLAIIALSKVGYSQDCINHSQIDTTAICQTVIAPVCGCDGVTYNNQCVAENYYGITSFTNGACQAQPCIDTSLINPGAFCPAVISYVCGCNGVTYDNSCLAQSQGGVTSWTDGICGIIGCINYGLIDSGAVCLTIYDPVCGCDGITYPNECVAEKNYGVTSVTKGACVTTSIIPVYLESSLIVFPNPTTGKINVVVNNNDNTIIKICNLVGEIVKEIQTNKLQTEIDLSNLQNGIYFIQSIQDNSSFEQKIVISK